MDPKRTERDRLGRWLLLVGVLTLVTTMIIGREEIAEFLQGLFSSDETGSSTTLLATSSNSSPASSTTTSAPPTTAATLNPLASVALEPLEADLPDEEVLAAFAFTHSGLCLTGDEDGGVTQETCEQEPTAASHQLWEINLGTATTDLRQGEGCLEIVANTEEPDPMGNTLGELGVGDCESDASRWRLAYVDVRSAFVVLTADRSRCLDVLGGKAWSGQPVVAYPCVSDFDNQFVTVRAGPLVP